MSERLFSLEEIDEAIVRAREMVIYGKDDPCRTKIIQMGGYIRRYLLETPSRKQGKAEKKELRYDKNTGFIGEGGGT